MSKRFGRNQKRRLREKIKHLEAFAHAPMTINTHNFKAVTLSIEYVEPYIGKGFDEKLSYHLRMKLMDLLEDHIKTSYIKDYNNLGEVLKTRAQIKVVPIPYWDIADKYEDENANGENI